MKKDDIAKQIMNLPEKSGFIVSANEMGKDLQEVMKDDEVIQGVTDACEKSISHFIKNGRMMRSFMAVTDKNVYLISRGRRILNTVGLLDKTTIIPRNEIIRITVKEVPALLKIFYKAEIFVVTEKDQYEIYLGIGYEKELPKNFISGIKVNSKEYGNRCPNCGADIEEDSKFCSNCGTVIPIKKEEDDLKKVCIQCGYELSAVTKFCPNCGTSVPEEKKKKPIVCLNCGNSLEDEAKFCPNCGAPVVLEMKEILRCPKCGIELEPGVNFCPECGTPVINEEQEN